MTTLTDFNVAQDIKVEFYLAGGNTNDFIIGISKIGGAQVLASDGFVIGQSLLGGSDILAGNATGFEWTDLACITTKANFSIGGAVKDQLYFQPDPAGATISLQSLERDPSYSPAFRPGVQMRIRLVRDSFEKILWSGFVDSINASYDAFGNNTLQVAGFDSFKRLMNTRLALFDSDTDFPAGYVSPYEQLELIAEAYGTSMHASSVDNGGKIPSVILEDVIPNNLIYDAIQVGLGFFWIDPESGEFVFVPRADAESSEDTPVIGNNHGEPNHLCMSDIKASITEDVVYNSLKVILKSDSETSVLIENQDSINLFGTYAQDVTLNTTDSTELERWANAVFVQSPFATVDSVETPAVDRLGNLTDAALFLPGQPVGIKYTTGVLEIDDFYTVTKVSHNIDPNQWFTTLEVWKEA